MMYQQFIYSPNEMIKEQYEVRACIGEGSEGKVYLVWDRFAKRFLALKLIILSDVSKEKDYEKQVQMLTKFGGTYFPVLINNFMEENRGYIFMEYVEGENLKEYLERNGGLDVRKALELVKKIGNGIHQLHTANESVVFGDLKAENIMIQKDENIKIIDFGGAYFYGDKVEGNCVGTFGYAPKEQWEKGKIAQKWWDVFALNKLFHYILTGNNPALPPYTAPSILEFDVTFPKALDNVLTKYNSEKVCEKTEVEDYLEGVNTYKKAEYWEQLKVLGIKCVEYILVCISILLFYVNVWGHNYEEILLNRKYVLISFLIFLIAVLYRKIFIQKRLSYRYQREKNIWKSAKKGICVFLVMVLVTELNSKAEGEEPKLLPVIFYNDARENVCIRENVVLKVSENLLIEIPIGDVWEGEIYELEISYKIQGENEGAKRKILFEKKP